MLFRSDALHVVVPVAIVHIGNESACSQGKVGWIFRWARDESHKDFVDAESVNAAIRMSDYFVHRSQRMILYWRLDRESEP